MKDNIVKNPRDLIARSYQNIIDENIKKDKAIFKNINFPTGVGKTHQAIKNSLKNIIYEEFGNCVDKLIKNNRKKHIIAVYIAPMNEHVADVLKTKFPDIEKNNIPIYQVSGKKVLGSHKNIKIYKNWVKYFYKASSQQGHYMYKFVNSLEPEQRDKIFKEIKSLNSKFKRINFFNTLDKSGCIDQKDKKDVVITKNMVINKLSELIEKLIRYISDDYTISTEDNQMIEILFPQFLLRNKSGILLFTYDKFIQKHKNFKFNRKKNKYTTSIKYFFEKDFYPNARFYYFLDETEPGYKRFFEIVTKTLRPDNNAFNNLFSAIYRETRWIFSDYTQNREIISYFKNNSQKNNEKFFENLINKGEHQKILPIDGLSNIEKKTIKLFQKHCHSAYYYSVTLDIYKKIEEQCNFIKKNDETFSIDTFLKVISFFKDCKTVIIDRDLYNKVSGDIENIFSYNNAYIYNPEVMETIFANKIQDESMVKLAEAKKKTDDPSLKEILLSIMAINNSIILDLASFLEKENQFEDTQSKSLNSWKQVVKSKNSFEDLFLENDLINNEQCEFVDEKYVYESNKTLFNVKMVNRYTRSSHKQKTKLRRKYKEISIGQTMIYTSPEKLLTTLLDKKNVVCVLSATGGFKNNLVDNYNFEYLENQSRLSGQFEVLQMDDFDLDVCQKVREYRNKIRHIEFTPFDIDKKTICEDKSFYSYYNQYVENFFDEETDSSWEIKKKFKLKELKTFFSYFFWLSKEKSINSGLLLTQNIGYIKKFFNYNQEQTLNGITIKQSSKNSDIFEVVNKNHNKTIKVIFYHAAFNQNYESQDENIVEVERFEEECSNPDYQKELLETGNQKVLLVSAYSSASKGLNPIIKKEVDGEVVEKDFDSLMLCMDPHFGPFDEEKNEPLRIFTALKHTCCQGEQVYIKDYNKILHSPEMVDILYNQKNFYIVRELIQSMGRTERRDYKNQKTIIFINSESRDKLYEFYKTLSMEEEKLLSVNNHYVYKEIINNKNEYKIKNYETHIEDEQWHFDIFNRQRNQLLGEIKDFRTGKKLDSSIIAKWEAIRSPEIFKNIKLYKNNLLSCGFLEEFIDSLFYQRSQDEKNIFIDTDNHQIISDKLHGSYDYEKLIRNKLLATFGEKKFENLRKFFIPNNNIFNVEIPRFAFFKDFVFPAYTENYTKKIIETEYISKYNLVPINNFCSTYKYLFEMFDLYYTKGNSLYCIDTKALSKKTQNTLSTRIKNKVIEKTKEIEKKYNFDNVNVLLLNFINRSNMKTDLIKHNIIATNLFVGKHLTCSSALDDFFNNKIL